MTPLSPGPSCPSEDAFAAFVEGELSPSARDRLEEHVDGCASCRELVALLAREALPPVPGGAGMAQTIGHGDKRSLPWSPPEPAVIVPSVLVPGDIVAGRFVIEERVAAGGMGTIFRARDRHTAELVAVKVLEQCVEGSLDRFEREALILAELRHPGIVRYVAHGPLVKASETGAPRERWLQSGGVFLAMEWLEGEDLAHRLKRGRLGAQDAIIVAERVAAALAVAHHRGIVHRDLKPSNIFLRSGRLQDLVLLDFGVARLVAPDFSLTSTGLLIGTPAYMAPEQASGQEAVDARADVFALGCLAFECVTGQRAFQAHQLQALLAKIIVEDVPRLSGFDSLVSPAFDDLVAAMLAKAPDKRPSDAGEVLRAFARTGLSLPPCPPTQTSNEKLALGKGELRVYSVVMALPGRADASSVALGGRGRATLAAFGGRVETLSDGSLLVTLGGTGAPTDQAARAARTALALRELLSPGAPIALATGRGDAVALYPLGEALDRAADLLRHPPIQATGAGPSPIRIDETTASLLDARFDLGEDESGHVLRRQKNQESVRTLLGKPTPCVGRDAELALLDALVLQSADESVARAVVVTGPAGIGKSRLRYELLRRVRARAHESGGPAVWIARGDPMRAGSTFGLIAEAVRETAGLYAGEPLEHSQQKLRARVARHVASDDLDRITEFLGELVGAPLPDGDERQQLRAARLDPTLMGDQIRRAWVDLVRAECAAGPLLLVLEDLHWGDLATVELIDTTLGLLADQRLAVVAMGRPETYDLFPALWERRSPQTLRLGALSRSASERLAKEVLGASATAETLRGVVDLAAGNAFYLEELLRAASEGRGESLPAAAYAMLTEEDRVLGHRLAADWLERAGELDAMTLAEHHERGGDGPIAAAWYRRAAADAAEGSDYASALARAERGIACGPDGAVRALLDLVRAEAHRVRGDNAAAYACAVDAMHRLEPGKPEWYTAGREAGIAAGNLGNVAAARTLAHEMHALQSRGPASSEALIAVAVVAAELAMGHVDEMNELIDAISRVLPAGDLTALAHVQHAKISDAYVAGNLPRYLEIVTSAMDTFHRIGDLRGYARAMVNLSVGHGMLGEWELAEASCRSALGIAERAGLGSVSMLARHNLGLPLIRLGRGEEALRELRATLSTFAQHLRLLVGTHEHIGLALASQGDFEAAEQELQVAVDLGLPKGIATRPLAALALVRLERGDGAGALAAAERALEALGRDPLGIYIGIVRLAHAEALAVCGQTTRALESALIGKSDVLARAAKLLDPARRESFLTRVPEHVRLVAWGA